MRELISENPKGMNHPKGKCFRVDPRVNDTKELKKGEVLKIDGIYRTAHLVERVHDFGGHPWVNICVTMQPIENVRENTLP